MVRFHPHSQVVFVATIYMKEEQKTNKQIYQPVMVFFAKTTSWVAVPAILALLIKKYLNISQILFFIIIGLAFVLTIFGIYKEIKDYKKTLEKNDK